MNLEHLNPYLTHRPRPANVQPELIVLHATAGSSVTGAVATLREKRLGYHYIIDKDGTIWKCAPIGSITYHAGSSYGPLQAALGVPMNRRRDGTFEAGCSVNSYSIGISYVNLNDGRDPYPNAQILACEELVRVIAAAVPIRWLTTHAQVSFPRKTDPKGARSDAVAAACGLEFWRRHGVPDGIT